MTETCIPDSGLLLVDKPQGVTSHDVVSCVRHLLHMKRVGHAGTLDPMATGLLIVGFGQATRLLNYILGSDKTYEAIIRLGEETTTDDAEGDVISYDDSRCLLGVDLRNQDPLIASLFARACSMQCSDEYGASNADSSLRSHVLDEPTRALLLQHLQDVIEQHLTGNIQQVPTAFSAIKVHGQRAYDLAREGKDVLLDARTVRIQTFNVDSSAIRLNRGVSGVVVLDIPVRVRCSSGTYIRALARDLGRLLGVGGHLIMLRRTQIGAYSLDNVQALALETTTRTFTDRQGVLQSRTQAVTSQQYDIEDLQRACCTMMQAARLMMPCMPITFQQARDIRFGRKISVSVDMNIIQQSAKRLGVNNHAQQAQTIIAYVSSDGLDSTLVSTSAIDVVGVLQVERVDVCSHNDVNDQQEYAKNRQTYQLKPVVVFQQSANAGRIEQVHQNK